MNNANQVSVILNCNLSTHTSSSVFHRIVNVSLIPFQTRILFIIQVHLLE